MCIILDANMLSRFKKRADEDIKPVWDWVYNRNGMIAYSTTEKFKEEWTRGGGDNVLKELQTIKKLKPVSAQDVQEKQNELEGQIRSNDPHIIALAIVANVRVLPTLRTYFGSLQDFNKSCKPAWLLSFLIFDNPIGAWM